MVDMLTADKKSIKTDIREVLMADWSFPRSIVSMRFQAELGVEHGLSMRACLQGTGIREANLEDPSIVVSGEQELQLIRNLVSKLRGVPALGVEAAMRYPYTTFGMLGFAMASSRNMRESLEIALRYFNLTFAFSRFLVTDSETETCITVDVSHLPEEVLRFVAERDAAGIATVQRGIFPNSQALTQMQFSFPTPRCFDPYEKAFGIRPVFGAVRTVAILSRKALLQPLPQASDLALKLAEEQCRSLLARGNSRVGLAAMVRDRMMQ